MHPAAVLGREDSDPGRGVPAPDLG